METEKLYYADPFLTEFDARVLACEAEKGGYAVVLDRTAFYPEGGGQPYDTGVLGGVEVSEVHEKAGVVTHKCAAPLPVGETVHGKLDWARRFDHMQQHSGEHICSGLICARYGCDNVGFHMGAESVTIDFNADIPWEELLEIEAAANRYIYEDHAIDIQLHRGAELDAIDYRSKKPLEGDVRIVTFPGADCCACCGTHTAATGQVGQIKILASENYKGGVRLSVVCGGRALREAQAMRSRQADIGALLSAKADQTAVAVHRVYDEYTALKFAHFGLCQQLFDAMAAQLGPDETAIRIVPGLDPDGLHRLAARLSEATTGLCAALTPNEKGTGYCIARSGGDVRPLTKALNAALNGRGGGKPGICQGSCTATPEQVEEFLRKAL